MTTILWIGFGFLIFLLLFLTITFFVKNITQSQYNTLHFLTALSAAFLGSFITGDALFRLDYEMANGFKLAISGTAGCALFFTIWFTYPKYNLNKIIDDAFCLSIPEGWSFQNAIRSIVSTTKGVCEFSGFTDEQLNLPLNSYELKTSSALELMKRLKYLSSNLPEYEVTLLDNVYFIKAK